VEFLEWGLSNHSPSFVSVARYISYGPKPFKFFNFSAEHPHFLDWVGDGWEDGVSGYAMFRLYSRLKSVKSILKTKNLWVNCLFPP
jgi:hypothetical protein